MSGYHCLRTEMGSFKPVVKEVSIQNLLLYQTAFRKTVHINQHNRSKDFEQFFSITTDTSSELVTSSSELGLQESNTNFVVHFCLEPCLNFINDSLKKLNRGLKPKDFEATLWLYGSTESTVKMYDTSRQFQSKRSEIQKLPRYTATRSGKQHPHIYNMILPSAN